MAAATLPLPAAFNFCSSWQLAAPRPAVWDALIDTDAGSGGGRDWRRSTTTGTGDADGIGQKAGSRWRGPIGYQLRFSLEAVELVEHELLRGRAEGDLSGLGSWHLSDDDGWTDVRLDWAVDATRKWMEFLAPIARPVFVHGHDYLMEQGANGLAVPPRGRVAGLSLDFLSDGSPPGAYLTVLH